jgi:hypothetical protein
MGLIRQRLHAWRGKRAWWVLVYAVLMVTLNTLLSPDHPWLWFIVFVALVGALGLLGEWFRRKDRAGGEGDTLFLD